MVDDVKLTVNPDVAPKSVNLEAGRRAFLSVLGAGLVGTALLNPASVTPAAAQNITDVDIFNFALQLEYLEAEFYLRGSTGAGLVESETSGRGQLGPVFGGRQVQFATQNIANYVNEIAAHERSHVQLIRLALGSAAVARPSIDIAFAFTLAARAAGLVGPNENFDVYANETNFLLGAYIFEDVGVTAYQGAAPLITNRSNLANAAALLAVESYHAGSIRTLLISRGLFQQADAISRLRNGANPGTNVDQGIGSPQTSNIVPTDDFGRTFTRTPQQVLNVVYLNAEGRPTGFFPNGLNGTIR